MNQTERSGEAEKAKISSWPCSKQRWTYRTFWWTSLGLKTWTWKHKGQVWVHVTKTRVLHQVHHYHMWEGSKRCWSDQIWHWRCASCWAEWCGCPKCRRLCSKSLPKHPATLLTWTRMLPYVAIYRSSHAYRVESYIGWSCHRHSSLECNTPLPGHRDPMRRVQ